MFGSTDRFAIGAYGAVEGAALAGGSCACRRSDVCHHHAYMQYVYYI